MTKKVLIYVAIVLISIISLICFLFSNTQYSIIEKTISADNTDIYIVREETYILNKSISEWGIVISTLGVIIGIVATFIEYNSNKKRIEQEKGAEIAKMFAIEIIDKLAIIINVLYLSKLDSIIKKKNKDPNSYSLFECSNFDKNEMRKIYGESIFEDYNNIRKKEDIQILYNNVIKALSSSKYDIKDIKEILSKIQEYEKNNPKNKKEYTKLIKKLNSVSLNNEDYNLFDINFPKKFDDLVYRTLNELEYLCMYISSKAANSEFIYQSLHQTFLKAIRLLAIEISKQNTNSCDKLYTNIIHVYNDWLTRYSKAQKKEIKNTKKSNKILNPKIKTIN